MAQNQLKDFHLFAMESALPVGLGIINNAKTGGIQQVIDVLQSGKPLSEFQCDGEKSAKKVRDKIDQFFPGLGHPVVSVDVVVEDIKDDSEISNQNSLVETLYRIDSHLNQLKQYFSNDEKNITDK